MLQVLKMLKTPCQGIIHDNAPFKAVFYQWKVCVFTILNAVFAVLLSPLVYCFFWIFCYQQLRQIISERAQRYEILDRWIFSVSFFLDWTTCEHTTRTEALLCACFQKDTGSYTVFGTNLKMFWFVVSFNEKTRVANTRPIFYHRMLGQRKNIPVFLLPLKVVTLCRTTSQLFGVTFFLALCVSSRATFSSEAVVTLFLLYKGVSFLLTWESIPWTMDIADTGISHSQLRLAKTPELRSKRFS